MNKTILNTVSTFCLLVTFVSSYSTNANVTYTTSSSQSLVDISSQNEHQKYPSVASDNKLFIVTWQQGNNYYGGNGSDIFAMRINANGQPVDGSAISVSKSPGSQELAVVSFNKGIFLVVWQDFRNGKDWDIYGTRITSNGKVLDPDGILIAGGTNNQTMPVITTAENGFLVIWQDFSTAGFYKIACSIVNAEGKTSDKQFIRYKNTDNGEWRGYTPGWGYNKKTVSAIHKELNEFIIGGNISAIRYNKNWIISWNDESNWAPDGRGIITRRIARLINDNGKLVVEGIIRPPSVQIGRSGGIFITGNNRMFYNGWGATGRGSWRGSGFLFNPETMEFVKNPNTTIQKIGSGWKPEFSILTYEPNYQIDGPITTVFSESLYITVAKGFQRLKQPFNEHLYISFMTNDGLRLNIQPDIIPLETGIKMNPVVHNINNALLLVYEKINEEGFQNLWFNMLKIHK